MVAGEWVVAAVVVVALGGFVAALAGKMPGVIGGMAGFIVGLGVLFPAGCVTRSDPVAETTCWSAVGVPVGEEAGMVGGIVLATILSMVFVWLPRRAGEKPADPRPRPGRAPRANRGKSTAEAA